MADNKENKVLNVPALRFPGFKNSWDCTILEKLSKKIGDGIHSTPSYDDDGTFYFINGNNLNRGKIVITSSTKRVSEKEAYKNNAENLEADSILMSINGTIGNVALYNNEPIMLGKSACYINSKDNVDKKFLFYYLQYPKTQSYFEAELTGTTIKNLSLQSIRKTKICIPTIEEQHKISHFLQKIDERIATQNKIIEKLETLIKGIIETVISSQKPNTLIKNCLECNSSTLQESQVAETGTFPVYGATGISGYTETADINGESILIIKDGSSVGIVKFVTGEYSYIGTLNSLIAKDGYCLKYIYFALQRFSFEPYKTGMAIPHIYFKDYGKAKIYCPSLSLQTLIAQKLSLIENKMEVEKRIILCYQLQKSYLLSRMFI